MNTRWTPVIAIALTLLVLALGLPRTAFAHGDLERSSPRANAVLTTSPDRVVLHMSEAVDLVLSEVEVFDKDGQRVDLDDVHLLDERSPAVSVDPLSPGTYTVSWKVTSLSDGHRTTGSFRFTVSGGGRLFLGTGAGTAESSANTRPSLGNTLTRWAELVGLALVTGTIGTMVLIWRPVLSIASRDAWSEIRRRSRLLVWTGLGVTAVSLVGGLLVRADGAAGPGVGLATVLPDMVLRSPTGVLFIARLGVIVALAGVWHAGRRGGEGFVLYSALGLVGLLVLGRSFGSHAAGTGGGLVVFSVAVDFVHLVAACLWVGGLAALLAGLGVVRRSGGGELGRLVGRFSNLAALSVGLIALTGLYNAWLEVGSLHALVVTPYGKVLLIKSGILLPLLALAAFNLLCIRSRIGGTPGLQAVERNAGRLGMLARGELVLALGVLAMTAVLANLPLARDAATRALRASEAPMAMPLLIRSHDINVTFGVTPNRVGTNSFLLELTDAIGNPAPVSAESTVRFSRLDSDLAGEPVLLRHEGNGRFSARGDALSVVGTWVATVTLQLEDDGPLVIDYVFRVADGTERTRSVVGGIADFLTGREPELPETGPLVPAGSEAETGLRLLRSADERMNRLQTLTECNNINGVVTLLDYSAPSLMRYVIRGGGEAVIDGDQQWSRRGDTEWRTQSRRDEFRFPEFGYAADASGVRREGVHEIDGVSYEVVSFYSERDRAEYWFWIDTQDFRLRRLLMNVPPSHYMVSTFDSFDGPTGILVPSESTAGLTTQLNVPERVPCDAYLP